MNLIIVYLWIQGVFVSDVFLMRTTKTWLSNTNFNNSKNWDLGRVPCSQDIVIFPKRMGFVVELPEGVTTLRQLVLPLDGELLLPFNGKLQVVSDTNDKIRDNKCHGKHDITYLQWKVPEWVNPKSWSGHTKATPDIEAIPCHTDNVIFPPKSSIRVLMPDTEVRVGSLSIHGQQMETRGWLEFMTTDEGKAQFLPKFSISIPSIDVTSQECNDKTGCACNNEDLTEEVCEVVTKECPNAPCIDPVTPYGNCCPICGAYLLFHYTNDFSMKNIQNYLERKLAGEYIDFHVSKVRGKIQIVLVEKEYDERVQDIIDGIHADVVKRTSLGIVPEREIVAGALISPPSFPRQLFLFFGCLLISTCTVAIIFYIYTDSCNLNAKDGKQYLFAVFENQSEEVELCGSNGTAPQQQPQQQEQQRLYESVKTTKRQAFDNPMYGSTSEVQVKHEDEDGELVEDCPIYSILEDIKLDKEDFEEEAISEEDSTTP